MAVGPVFRAELLRSSRRGLAYGLRSVYGVVLLLVIWSRYTPLGYVERLRGLYYQDLARFALDTFVAFMVVQLATLLVLIPALCGGAVADEKQRKTLHYLMASELTSREIVLDKLFARLFHAGVYVLAGVPVMSLLSLFGGVPWEYVIAGYAVTASIVAFAASLALFVSVLARRVKQGVMLAYMAEVAWLIGPPLAAGFVQFVFPRVFALVGPAAAYGMNSSPVSLYVLLAGGGALFRGGLPAVVPYLVGMVGLQVLGASLLVVCAVALLRPVFRKQEEKPRRVDWFRNARRVRVFARPPCGEDAMLWKERHFTRTDVLTKVFVLPATVVLTVGLILTSQLDEAVGHVIRDSWQGDTAASLDRARVADAVRIVTPCYVALWLLAIAGAAASCITVEREQDTWVSLIASPLGAWEIVRGKVLGAVWGLRGFGVLLILFWGVGWLLGTLSLSGLLLATLTLVILTWFVAALGAYLSLGARTTARALTSVIVWLVILNGGCLALVWLWWRAAGVGPFVEPIEVMFSPALVGDALTVPERLADIQQWVNEHPAATPFVTYPLRKLVYGAALAGLYAAAALVLTLRTSAAFDRINDRPGTRGGAAGRPQSVPADLSRTAG